jgi:O-antigen ligase
MGQAQYEVAQLRSPTASVLHLVVLPIALYLACSPIWYPALAARMYDNARIFQLWLLIPLAALAAVPAVFRALRAAWEELPAGIRILLGVFFAGAALSAALSQLPKLGALQVSLMLLLVLLALLVCTCVRKEHAASQTAFSAAICAGAAFVVLEFWTGFLLTLNDGREFPWVSPFLHFANVRFFGQYQAYALLLVPLIAGLAPLSRAARWAVYLVSANFWALQFMVGTRAVWFGFAVAILTVLACAKRGRLVWLRTHLLLVAGGAGIFLVFSWLVLQPSNATPIPAKNSVLARNSESIEERNILAKTAVQLIGRHPFAGVGPGQFGFYYGATAAAHPHNTPLQLWSEYGLVAGSAGVALYAALGVLALRRMRTDSAQAPDLVTTTLAAALLMGLGDALFSGNLTMPHSQVLCFVLAGWLIGRGSGNARESPARRAGMRQLALPAIAVMAALVTALLALDYLNVIREMPYPPELRAPSFWQYGRFDAW